MARFEKKDFRQDVVDEIIAHLEEGTAPWQKPWNAGEIQDLPHNPVSGAMYRGINNIILEMKGRDDPRWLTYKQATSRNAQVRKGEKGSQIEFWKWSESKPVLDDNGKPVLDKNGKKTYRDVRLERPKVFHATVFNAEQIDGLEPYVAPEMKFYPAEEAEKIISETNITINHLPQDMAFYRPSTDEISLPPKEAFETAEQYYATALHEIGHATGHKSRLNRDLTGGFGSASYAKEELRAEISSYMTARVLGIGHDPSNHASYVKSWLKALREDKNEIFRASRDAEYIHEWVLNKEKRIELEERAKSFSQAKEVKQQEQKDMELHKIFDKKGNVLFEAKIENTVENEKTCVEMAIQEGISLENADLEAYELSGINLRGVNLKGANFACAFLKGADLSGANLEETNGMEAIFEGANFEGANLCRANFADSILSEANFKGANLTEASLYYAHVKNANLENANLEKAIIESANLEGANLYGAYFEGAFLDRDEEQSKTKRLELEERAKIALPMKEAKEQERTYLSVPYPEKNQAKALGARWDKRNKSWYVKAGIDTKPFEAWLNKEELQKTVSEPKLSPQEEFANFLKDNGFEAKGSPIMDGKWHRTTIEGDKKGKKSGSYRAFLDGQPNGQINNYKTGENDKWVYLGQSLTQEEKAELRKNFEKIKETRKAEQQAQYKLAAKKAFGVYTNLKNIATKENCPYLAKKDVHGYGVKINNKGDMIIPVKNSEGFIWSMQTVNEENKRFLTGSRKAGCMHVIDNKAEGNLNSIKTDKIYLAEGYATAATIHELTESPVVVAFDASNLKEVSAEIRKAHPKAEIIIAADNDHKLKNNVGIEKATEAAKEIGAKVIAPEFSQQEMEQGCTDFNDLIKVQGKDVTKEYLLSGDMEKVFKKGIERKSILRKHKSNIKEQAFGLRV
ncbi:MAG: pentapeptide repeat-containing protein [Alphaproteobacteria bacterium]|nr:pentapeptide repeat-containing protein [Alphaproteobacteria bacterium]